MTERYAHLKPELFTAKDLGTIPIDLTPGSAEATPIGQTSARAAHGGAPTWRVQKRKAGAAL